jgi:hypothetical protein
MPVNVTGVKELIKAINLVDPELNKQMQKSIREAMIPIRDTARRYLPDDSDVLSGWRKINVTAEQKYRAFPFYNQEVARNGVYFSAGKTRANKNGFSFTHFVANKSASGAIFETAGRKNPGGDPKSESLNPRAGIHFIQSAQNASQLKGDGMQRGRAIYRAWYEDSGKVYPAVIKAIDITATKFNNGQMGNAA